VVPAPALGVAISDVDTLAGEIAQAIKIGVDQIEMSIGVAVGQLKKERYPANAGIDPERLIRSPIPRNQAQQWTAPKSLCAQLRHTVIMKRPYRDVLVWLAGIRPPNHDLAAERAIAAVIAMLAAYDRDQRLAARWEERFLSSAVLRMNCEAI
jgi:hypothetical protein